MSNPVIASTRGSVHLTGVAETMLWTLHDRAREAMRDDTFLRDPDCVRIYRAISYDYERSFGKPDGSHPMRSRMFDEAVRRWMRAHPGGAVVELAAGLETQFQRVDDGKVNWSCVDVPEAIALRDRFLPPSDRCSYVAQSALDLGWLDEIDASRGVFVSAQGLLMYFEEAQVRRLFCAMVDRWPGVEILFDTIPRWFSEDFVARAPKRIEEVRAMMRRCSIEGYAGCGRAISVFDFTAELPKIKTRTMIVVGRDDASATVADAEAMQRGIAGSQLRVIEKTRHLPNVEDPKAFNAIMSNWLQ